MAEQNGTKALTSENHHEYKEIRKSPVLSATENSIASNGTSIAKDKSNLKNIPKDVGHSVHERNVLLPLLQIDSRSPNNSNTAIPNTNVHLPRTSNRDPESPTTIVEASDVLLDPSLYRKYSICTGFEDTFNERLAKQMETIKNVTRDRAVDSITAGENAVYWLVNSFKYLTSGWFGLVILLIAILTYGSFGALIFMALESPHEQRYNVSIIEIRTELADKIKKITTNETMMKTDPDFLTLIQADLEVYENKYSEYIKHNVTQLTWNFGNSFIFAGTIFTTIGYGHIAPKTTSGRAATIVYAIIGIPLFLTVLTSFGKFLTRIIKFFWIYILCSRRINTGRKAPVQEVKTDPIIEAVYRPSGNSEETPAHLEIQNKTNPGTPAAPDGAIENDEDFNLPIIVAMSILIFYMLCGAVVAHFLESWSFFDSFYCVFISMSTIGLGDLVISDSMYMIYSILYIIFGLSLTAMCIDVVQRNFTIMFKNACDKLLSLVNECESSSENGSAVG